MSGHETLAEAAGFVAGQAGEALRRLAADGALERDTRAARELVGVLKDALAIERELRAGESAAAVVVRFEGETEEAAG